jgi:uncharacterized membrane protein YeaQ/YmgE (transglycosylase-associated protein family)
MEEPNVMGVIGWLILGLAAGAIARGLHREADPSGLAGVLLVGALGALLGGLIASAIGLGEWGSLFSVGTWLFAVGGALLLLAIYGAVLTRSGRLPRDI